MNVADFLDLTLSERSENIALSWGNSRISYSELRTAVLRLGAGLKKIGINKGDRVLLMLPNIPHFTISYYAVLSIGAVVVPANIMFKEREISYQIEDSEAVAVIGWEGFVPELMLCMEKTESLKYLLILGDNIPPNGIQLTRLISENKPLEKVEDVEPDDTAVIMYTSGMTGHPKGAELPHRSMIYSIKILAETLRFNEREKILSVVPFFHSFGGTVVMNAGLYGGSTLLLAPKFNPKEVLELIVRDKATIFAGVPTMFQLLLDNSEREDLRVTNLKYCLSGGSSLSVDLLEKFEEKFSTYILEGYGLSETCAAASFNNFKRERKPGSIGYPLDGVEMKILDEADNEVPIGEVGEIAIQGPNLMSGYRNRPTATDEVIKDDWFHTGDLGKMDMDGYFYLVARKTDMILKGGFKVFPREIEDIIMGHPQVKEVAVIGIPDAVMGEDIKACIVPREGMRINPAALLEYCRERMANYKCPAVLRFYRELPKGPTGRILRKELKR